MLQAEHCVWMCACVCVWTIQTNKKRASPFDIPPHPPPRQDELNKKRCVCGHNVTENKKKQKKLKWEKKKGRAENIITKKKNNYYSKDVWQASNKRSFRRLSATQKRKNTHINCKHFTCDCVNEGGCVWAKERERNEERKTKLKNIYVDIHMYIYIYSYY